MDFYLCGIPKLQRNGECEPHISSFWGLYTIKAKVYQPKTCTESRLGYSPWKKHHQVAAFLFFLTVQLAHISGFRSWAANFWVEFCVERICHLSKDKCSDLKSKAPWIACQYAAGSLVMRIFSFCLDSEEWGDFYSELPSWSDLKTAHSFSLLEPHVPFKCSLLLEYKTR